MGRKCPGTCHEGGTLLSGRKSERHDGKPEEFPIGVICQPQKSALPHQISGRALQLLGDNVIPDLVAPVIREGYSALPRISADQLIRNVVQIFTDDARLGAYPQYVIADPFDQRRVPARRNGSERIPGMTGDKTELRRTNA